MVRIPHLDVKVVPAEDFLEVCIQNVQNNINKKKYKNKINSDI